MLDEHLFDVKSRSWSQIEHQQRVRRRPPPLRRAAGIEDPDAAVLLDLRHVRVTVDDRFTAIRFLSTVNKLMIRLVDHINILIGTELPGNRETAEELTIDVFHDVWRRASHYDAANGTVLGWIMNQARSRAIDRLRFENRKKRVNGADVQPLAEAAADPRDVIELREQGEALRAALAALTPDERQAIETTFFAGLTHAEAAARLNQPLGTIKTRIRSGLHKLRHALTAERES